MFKQNIRHLPIAGDQQAVIGTLSMRDMAALQPDAIH